MKKNQFTLVILIITSLFGSLHGQNLVKNYSFELYHECPTKINQLGYCDGWFSTGNGSTPEYFNGCSKYNSYIGYSVGIPGNLAGSQKPRTGNGYSGIVLLAVDSDFHYREYVQGTLIDTLKKGVEYTFSFYISLAEYSSFFSDRISICFTQTQRLAFKIPYSILECKNPVTIKAIDFSNSIEWVEVRGSYLASGGEKFITIGLFLNDLTKKEYVKLKENNQNGGQKHCYYYIDDVSVIEGNGTLESSHQIRR